MQPTVDRIPISSSGAKAVVLGSDRDLPQAVDQLGLNSGSVLVLVGGADSMASSAESTNLRNLFFEVLAPLAESLQATVIDGGTDSGVMRLMGAARSEIRGTFPLVGVAAIDTIELPERSGKGTDTAALESRHSHFLIVPGDRWGDESPWIARLASYLSNGPKSLTVVVNGGAITMRDISFSIREKRPILVFSGSGRTADRVAAGLQGENGDPEVSALVASGLIRALDIDRCSAELMRSIRCWFSD